ncbi:MAG: ribosomal protein S18-alanine N-acetyltransferase [Nitrospiria bacterium]
MNFLQPKFYFESAQTHNLPEIMTIDRHSFPYPWTERMFISEIYDNPCSFSYVVKDVISGKIVAFLIMRKLLDELHLMSLAVHPESRRQGIGEAMIRKALSTGTEKGMEKVILEVRASNIPAQALYQKLSFVKIAIRKKYYIKPTEDAFLFQCLLSSGFSNQEGKQPLVHVERV